MLRFTYARLLVADYRACFRFYQDVLGLKATFGDIDSGYADFDTGEVSLALFDRQEMSEALRDAANGEAGRTEDRIALIFEVDNVDTAFETLRGRGAAVASEPADHPEWGIRTAHFRDPDGNLVEINTPLSR